MPGWQIKDWGRQKGKHRLFMCAQSAKYDNPAWVPWPINLTGERYRILAAHPDGQRAYGLFGVFVALAAVQPCKGLLFDVDGALTIGKMSARSGVPAGDLQWGIQFLSAGEIRWLQPVSDRVGRNRVRAAISQASGSKVGASYEPEAEAEAEAEQAGRLRIKTSASAPEQTACQGGEILRDGPACLPPTATLREVLAECGVEDPALARIAASGRVTAEEVRAAWAQVQAGAKRKERPVRDPIGALTAALCRKCGIALKPKAHVGSTLAAMNDGLLRLRAENRAVKPA